MIFNQIRIQLEFTQHYKSLFCNYYNFELINYTVKMLDLVY